MRQMNLLMRYYSWCKSPFAESNNLPRITADKK